MLAIIHFCGGTKYTELAATSFETDPHTGNLEIYKDEERIASFRHWEAVWLKDADGDSASGTDADDLIERLDLPVGTDA